MSIIIWYLYICLGLSVRTLINLIQILEYASWHILDMMTVMVVG